MLPWAAGSHIFFNSSIVMQVIQSFFGFTTILRASYATGSSMNEMPLAAHASISEALIGRDASLMSISPLQNFENPPPVPERPTVTRTLLLLRTNSSATASDMGKTVLEPSMVTEPPSPSTFSPPVQPDATATMLTAKNTNALMALITADESP